VVQASQDRAVELVTSRSQATVAVIAFSLFLDYFFYGLLVPLLPHSPAKLQGEGQFALLFGTYAISVLLVTPVFGYLGDRIGSRSTMLCGVALAVCSIALFGVGSSFPLLLLGKLCQGAASAALWTSGLALIATNYPTKRVEMIGFAFAGGTLGSIIGPMAGGFLANAGSYQLPFLITGILAGIDGALIAFLLHPGATPHEPTADLRALLFNKSLLAPALAVGLSAFSVGLIEPLLPVRLERLGVTPMAVGVIFTIATLAYGLSAPLVGRVSERLPIQKVIVLGAIAMAVTLPLLAIFQGVVLVCMSLVLVNISWAFMLNPASAELGNVVERSGLSCYSAVYAVYNVAYSVGMLATAGLASAAAHWLNFWGVLLSASAILLLSLPLLTMAGLPQAAPAKSRG
jgi:MFS transporter, DHA1 family, solute carrier family 18 (vesicular amine transporter), member 1/2